ncbi:MAG: hypothetical protein M3419_04625 [Actinomycetota bacterium]|nr:hypothetical protein [Actinomycetota bacterium]
MKARRWIQRIGLGAALIASSMVAGTSSSQADESGVGSSGSCSGVANGSGINLYCLAAEGGATIATIAQLLGGAALQPCMHSRIPDGMKPPVNPDGSAGEYWMMSCLSGVDVDTITGGEDVTVQLSFDFVEEGTDPITYGSLSEAERRIWRRIEYSGYPIPFTAARPSHVVRVNQYTFFQFRWMTLQKDGSYEVARGPGTPADDENGDPFIEIGSGTTQARAEASGVVIDANIKGMPDKDCGADPPLYDFEADPLPGSQYPGGQDTECYFRFEHSSAAAEELSEEIPMPEGAEDFPVPVFIMTITVTWSAEMQTGDAVESLGEHDMVVQQAIPVTEIPGLVGNPRP